MTGIFMRPIYHDAPSQGIPKPRLEDDSFKGPTVSSRRIGPSVVLVAVAELTSAAGPVSGEDVMAYMLVRNKVRDFDVWKEVFDGELGAVRDAGLGLVHLWRSMEDTNEVFFLLSISDMERARAFTADPASAAAGERAGVAEGEIHYVEDVA
jgi:hypothetical protein